MTEEESITFVDDEGRARIKKYSQTSKFRIGDTVKIVQANGSRKVMDCQSHVYTHHALLIGIDSYQEKPLRGCVRDVQETRKLLDSMPKPAVVDTELLTASRNMDAKRCTSLEETPRLPTYHNVIESFKRITSQAKAGSFVYIHFSGHGTAFRPPLMSAPTSVFSNRSTGDLALNLLDSDGQTRYLHGSELVYLLEAMVSKKLIVTLVLDCCFSGSVMRTDANASASSSAAQSGNCIMEGIKGNAYNDTSIRFLDYDPNIVATHDTPSGSASHQNMHAEYRHASLRPNWLVNPNGYTVLTACGPTEIAREIQVDGNVHGALSYFLNEAFRKLGGIGGRQRHIYQYLRARFLETQKRYGHNQIPMLYGNKDLFFFGKANARTGSAPIPVTGNSRSGFFLEAGQAHGISRDDEFSICAFATLSRSSWGAVSTSSPVAARVRNVGVFISELDVPQTVAASNDVLMATPQTRLALRRLPILLDLSGAHADAWAEVVKEQRSLAVHGVNEKDYINSCCFAVSMSTDGFYEIRELSSQTLLRLPATPTAPKEDAMQLLETLRHLARYELTRRLTNNISGAQTNAFNHSFGVHIIDADGNTIRLCNWK
ncbi:peptidase C14, caspase catalytic [Stemphylium lycopersici]|uniref:Peptidase C14, caspase catalytic n=1 Tax=Stemphylium lycopersici TaxID=183478 RepID=A0A364MWM0_STELY|nr:peptidase C14, caspase catalytic [Stemphylium lycopersici]RAR05714.1 peptidase C14, caspase catalytic [Stemphylium lycopersici]